LSGNEEKEKKDLSYGKIITEDQFRKEPIFPNEIKGIKGIQKAPFYLLIFIPGDKQVKMNLFPTETRNIKKILVKLTQFSPAIVKDISEVLKDINTQMIHTTGICFSQKENYCYYESYINMVNIPKDRLESVRTKLCQVPSVLNFDILSITGGSD
jgi:hypothetical protein